VAAAALAVVEAACLVGRQLAADTAATAEAVVTATVPSAGTAACDEATIQLLQAQGASLHTIAARLNADTSRTVTGARWTHRSVATVLAGGPPPAKARVRRRAPAAPRPRAPQTGRPVFVVDADPACRELIRTSLSALGLGNPCVEFSDGASVVRAMQQCLDVDGAELPALVLLDADLAGTSGADVLEWMAARTGLGATPPVIMLSARASAGDVNRAYRLGARSYLVKPVGFSAIGSVARDLGLAWMLV
jgi:CheY-like chemotaxis protein